MIDISLGGLIGAIAGTVVAALIYALIANPIERAFAKHRAPADPGRSATEIALLRRVILAADILVFAGLGYWLGHEIAG
jgi:hypothetical protein